MMFYYPAKVVKRFVRMIFFFKPQNNSLLGKKQIDQNKDKIDE